MKLSKVAASLIVALLIVAGCYSDQSLNPPAGLKSPMFRRYVSIGTSISGGFQSLGWNDSTQRRAFPVLFATAAGTPFTWPAFNVIPPAGTPNGCPPPWVRNAPPSRGTGAGDTTCTLRQTPVPSYLNNLAVPGTTVWAAVTNDSVSLLIDPFYSQLNTFVLAGRPMVSRMLEEQPTFVSVELGANDVLGALLDTLNPGNPLLVTPTAKFTAGYTEVVDSVAAAGPQGVVLFGVPDVTNIPFTSSGTIYFCLKTGACPGVPAGGFPPNYTVLPSCAPNSPTPGASRSDSILVPWTVGIEKLLIAAQGIAQTLDCSDDAQVVTPTEFANMRSAVAAYNAFISTQATQHGWAYVDLDALLAAAKQDTSMIRPFPGLSTVQTNGIINFGKALSLDGFHPSNKADTLITQATVGAVNAKYGLQLTFP